MGAASSPAAAAQTVAMTPCLADPAGGGTQVEKTLRTSKIQRCRNGQEKIERGPRREGIALALGRRLLAD